MRTICTSCQGRSEVRGNHTWHPHISTGPTLVSRWMEMGRMRRCEVIALTDWLNLINQDRNENRIAWSFITQEETSRRILYYSLVRIYSCSWKRTSISNIFWHVRGIREVGLCHCKISMIVFFLVLYTLPLKSKNGCWVIIFLDTITTAKSVSTVLYVYDYCRNHIFRTTVLFYQCAIKKYIPSPSHHMLALQYLSTTVRVMICCPPSFHWLFTQQWFINSNALILF